jgi:hypothetical protein
MKLCRIGMINSRNKSPRRKLVLHIVSNTVPALLDHLSWLIQFEGGNTVLQLSQSKLIHTFQDKYKYEVKMLGKHVIILED